MPDCHPLMEAEFVAAGFDITDPKIKTLLDKVYDIHASHIDQIGEEQEKRMKGCPARTLRRAAREFPAYTRDMVSRQYVIEWLNSKADEREQ